MNSVTVLNLNKIPVAFSGFQLLDLFAITAFLKHPWSDMKNSNNEIVF